MSRGVSPTENSDHRTPLLPQSSMSQSVAAPPSYEAAVSSPPAVIKPGEPISTAPSVPMQMPMPAAGAPIYAAPPTSMPANQYQYQSQFQNQYPMQPPMQQIVVAPAAPKVVVVVQNGPPVAPLAMPYTPPALDNTILTKIPRRNTSMTGSETNYTVSEFTSPEDITAFFISHTEVPEYRLRTVLSHTETRTSVDSQGNTTTTTTTVVDYTFTFDPTSWIQAPGYILGLEEGVKQFLRSSKQLNKCTLHKIVRFDVASYGEEMRRICRERGYIHTVHTTPIFEQHSEKTTIHAASTCHTICDSNICKCFLFITCLCLCWGPLKACAFEDNCVVRQEMQLIYPPIEYARYCSRDMPPILRSY